MTLNIKNHHIMNVCAVSLSCLSILITLSAHSLLTTILQTVETDAQTVCPSDYTWNGTQCELATSTSKVCLDGGALLNNGNCLVSAATTFGASSFYVPGITGSSVFDGGGGDAPLPGAMSAYSCPPGYRKAYVHLPNGALSPASNGETWFRYITNRNLETGGGIEIDDWRALCVVQGLHSYYQVVANASVPTCIGGFTQIGGTAGAPNPQTFTIPAEIHPFTICGTEGAQNTLQMVSISRPLNDSGFPVAGDCPSGFSQVPGFSWFFRGTNAPDVDPQQTNFNVLCAQISFQIASITSDISYPATCPQDTTPTTLTTCSVIQTVNPTGYIINNASVGQGTCDPISFFVGNTTTCTFPLTGSPSGTYTLPPQGLFAGITNTAGDTNSYLGNSSACTVSGAVLTCTSVPSAGGSTGNKNVIIHQPGIAWFDSKEDVTLVARSQGSVAGVRDLQNDSHSNSGSSNSLLIRSGTTTQQLFIFIMQCLSLIIFAGFVILQLHIFTREDTLD